MGIPATLGYTHTDAKEGIYVGMGTVTKRQYARTDANTSHCEGSGILAGLEYAHTDAKEGEGTMALDRRAFNRTVAAPLDGRTSGCSTPGWTKLRFLNEYAIEWVSTHE